MEYFKKLDDLPVFPDLLDDLDRLLASKTVAWNSGKQICLTSTPEQPDNTDFGCNSLIYDWDKQEKITDENGKVSINVPLRENPLTEQQFTHFNSQFKNTYFETIYNALNTNYNIGRLRLMRSFPKTCLSWHNDGTPRIHYPVSTQEGCFMVIEDQVKYLEANTWWFTDTTYKHTAFNASKKERVHLVAVVL